MVMRQKGKKESTESKEEKSETIEPGSQQHAFIDDFVVALSHWKADRQYMAQTLAGIMGISKTQMTHLLGRKYSSLQFESVVRLARHFKLDGNELIYNFRLVNRGDESAADIEQMRKENIGLKYLNDNLRLELSELRARIERMVTEK